jgi:hypothetical protein
VSSFPLGFDFHQKSPKRITPLFLFLHRTSYTNWKGACLSKLALLNDK